MIQWVDGILTRWGVWLQNGRGAPGAGQLAAWLEAGRSTSAQPPMPKINMECSRAHDWIRTLSKGHQQVLLQVYCTGASSIEHARVLQVSTRTLYARLHSLQSAYAHHADCLKKRLIA